MKRFLCVLFILTATLSFAEEPAKEPAKQDANPETLATVSWTHPGDGGLIKFTAYTDGTFLITKAFTPAKEGDKVPVLEPLKGAMQERRFEQLKRAVEAVNWAEIKAEYPPQADIDRTNGPCTTYEITAIVKGETYATKLDEAKNNNTIPGSLKFIAMIGRIMHDVRFNK